MDLERLKIAILFQGIIITQHAEIEMVNDSLDITVVKDSIKRSEMIEDYPHSKPLPSCLVLC